MRAPPNADHTPLCGFWLGNLTTAVPVNDPEFAVLFTCQTRFVTPVTPAGLIGRYINCTMKAKYLFSLVTLTLFYFGVTVLMSPAIAAL